MIITRRADEIVPGDLVDLKTWSLGDFERVTKVRYIEHSVTRDEVEFTFEGTAISNTRVFRVNRLLDVAA